MATTSNRSGSAATTSSVWVPIDPVDPAIETVVREEPTRPAYEPAYALRRGGGRPATDERGPAWERQRAAGTRRGEADRPEHGSSHKEVLELRHVVDGGED